MPCRAIAGTDLRIHELLTALGVELEGREVNRVTITIAPDECVILVEERNLALDEAAAALPVVKKYGLHVVEEEAPAES